MGLIVSSSGRGFDAAKQSGHGYSSITVQGSAKAQLGNSTHNGDVVHVTCEHFHGTFSGNPTVDSPEASTFGSERPLVKRKRHMHDGEDQSQRQHHTLGAVLTKLGEFSCSIKHQKLSKDARSVARHLCILLDNMRGGELVSDHVQEDWERLKNSITVTERIVINALPARIARANVVRVDRKRDVIRFGQWKISLTTAVFHSRDAIGRESTETESAIRIEPSTHLVGPVIAVFVGERTDFFGKSFVHPIVFAYRSVHNGSQIFALIKEDDIDGLMNLLATQGATTRDCDEQNRSLLYVSRP